MVRKCLLLSVLAAAASCPLAARAQSAAPAAQDSRLVLFVAPAGLDPARVDSLRKALEAQFTGVDARLVFESFLPSSSDLSSRARNARRLAEQYEARGVFWLEFAGEDWLLYLSERDAERILVRRLSLEGSTPAAAEETVSLIARQSTSALFAGQTVGMQPVAATPPSLAPPVRAPPPVQPPAKKPPEGAAPAHGQEKRSFDPPGLWLDVGYVGTTYAQQLAWQNGIGLGGRWVAPRGYYARVGYVFTGVIDVESPIASIEVSRHPIEVSLGWRFSEERAALRVELGYVLDIVTRTALSAQAGLERTPAETRLTSALAPRLGFEVAITGHVSAFAMAGMDFVLNDYAFVAQVEGSQRSLLNPHSIRASGSLGIGFHP